MQLAFHIVFGFTFYWQSDVCSLHCLISSHTHKHGTRESEQAQAQVWRSSSGSPLQIDIKKKKLQAHYQTV